MIVIVDSSALLALATCQSLNLLEDLYGDIRVPSAVFEGLAVEGKPQSELLAAYLEGKVAHVRTVDQEMPGLSDLGRGEGQAIQLYRQISSHHG